VRGKLFAGLYALYSGMVFLVVVGIVVAPVFHRILHRFHLEDASRGTPGERPGPGTGTASATGSAPPPGW
jgi:hypothetical protein